MSGVSQSRSLGLEGRIAVITGAAHGQGRASALAFAREGAHVVALDVARPLPYPGYAMGTPGDLEGLAEACRALGVDCLTAEVDVRDDQAVTRAVQAAADRFGRIDVLFNNAGICGYGLAHELAEVAWDAMLDTNLKGAWLVARRVIPQMVRSRSGVIINNSSVAGLRGMARLSHYAASKWGLVGLTKSWALELAPYGIRVVSVHPTGVNTPMNDGLAELEGLSPFRSRSAPPGTSCRSPGSSRMTSPRPSSSSPPTGRGTSRALSSSWTPGC
jgi:NAD(P)-dependent dehydrogenase (short-subunit alcohol dehydrogenase family)